MDIQNNTINIPGEDAVFTPIKNNALPPEFGPLLRAADERSVMMGTIWTRSAGVFGGVFSTLNNTKLISLNTSYPNGRVPSEETIFIASNPAWRFPQFVVKKMFWPVRLFYTTYYRVKTGYKDFDSRFLLAAFHEDEARQFFLNGPALELKNTAGSLYMEAFGEHIIFILKGSGCADDKKFLAKCLELLKVFDNDALHKKDVRYGALPKISEYKNDMRPQLQFYVIFVPLAFLAALYGLFRLVLSLGWLN